MGKTMPLFHLLDRNLGHSIRLTGSLQQWHKSIPGRKKRRKGDIDLSAVAMENVPKLELSPVKIVHLDNDVVSAPEAQKPVISAPEACVRHGTAMHDSMDLATHTPVDTPSEPKRPKTLFYRVLLWLLIQGPWILMIGLVYPVFIWYATCRVFIVAESFLSLRRVPTGVYETVSWAQYIPHF